MKGVINWVKVIVVAIAVSVIILLFMQAIRTGLLDPMMNELKNFSTLPI